MPKPAIASCVIAFAAPKDIQTEEKRTHTESEAGQASAKRSKEALDKVAREIQKIKTLEAETHSVQ